MEFKHLLLVVISCIACFILGGLSVFLASKKYLVYSQKIEKKEPIDAPKPKRADDTKSVLNGVEEMLGYDGKSK